jgi:hypothetical protein
MSEHEQTITELHRWYCKRSGLDTKLFFSYRLWHDRLRDYQYDAEKLRGDCDLIVRYFKREIARDKRNVGALKLQNFLQPDNFDADLALARLASKTGGKSEGRGGKDDRQDAGATTYNEERARAGAEHLRNFRKSLAGGNGK